MTAIRSDNRSENPSIFLRRTPPSLPFLPIFPFFGLQKWMLPDFAQRLHNLLIQSISNDTNLVKAATAQLNQDFYKSPACISALASIVANSPEQPVRQLAAVEMRKRVGQNSGRLWMLLPQNEREEIKSKLPTLMLAEPSDLVRHSAARVIASIASNEFVHGTWPQLLPSLIAMCSSNDVKHREVAVYIIYTVLEAIVETFEGDLTDFFRVFGLLLVDPASLEVRITTVKALGVLAQYIDIEDKKDLKAIQILLPAIFQVIGQTVESSNENGARQLFDVLETLLILEVPILSKHIPELAHFLLQYGGNRNFDNEMRILALNALNWTVRYKKSKIQSHNLAGAILEGLMPITTEVEPEDVDDDVPSRSAQRIIDGLSSSLPPSQVFPPLHNLILQYYSSPDPANRRGAMLSLGIAVEGCSEYMTPLMPEIWPLIEAGLQDADATVRKATCTTIDCLCEWLEDECASRHAILFPAVMNLVNDSATQLSGCAALDALLEISGDVIEQYLQLIMERFAGLLETAPIPVKSVVTGAIGSAAYASKERFLPYFRPTMDRLQHFVVLTKEGEETELRGITMGAIGTFAEAVGKDIFRPYLPDMMEQAFQGITLGSARLRECSFLFFSVMARVFGEEFASYLPSVMPPLLNSFEQSEHGDEVSGLQMSEAATAFSSGSSPADADEGDMNGDLDFEDADLLGVNNAIVVEKEIAADTLGTLFSATQNHFLPYVEISVLKLVPLLSHFYGGIRKSATDSLLEIVGTFYDLSDHQAWEPGTVPLPLDHNVKKLINHALEPLLGMYETEDNKAVVSALLVGLAEITNKIGPAFTEGNVEFLCNMAVQILSQKAPCQQDPDQDEAEEAPEDQAEYDSVLISSAGDLVAALANVIGPEFAPAFNDICPLITKYYKKNRSVGDRSAAIAALAEIIAGMKNGITPHTELLLDLFFRALNDAEPGIQSNAAFAIGLLVECSEIDLSSQYLNILSALRPLFDVVPGSPPTRLTAKDNAAGAVSRLIYKNTSAIPFDRVMPIFIGGLPLTNDFSENTAVFRALFHMFRTDTTPLRPYTEKLLNIFLHVLGHNSSEQITDAVREELINLIAALNAESPQAIQEVGLAAYLR
ncbi:hypothetical protein AX15_002131 [Amanita polypyramis BW_CC]|nr:hypothetical protein AX15_002131 [Amanita polypyramis BW_CC]